MMQSFSRILHSFSSARRGFTLFELLAVLTIISIGLVVLVGAYGSWGTAHALTGATRVLEAGLAQARTMAMAQNAYMAFEYGSVVTNDIKTVTGFQIYRYTNENAEVAAELDRVASSEPTALDLPDREPAAPYQRLSGYVRLKNVEEKQLGDETSANSATFVFRPDGSAWSWDDKRAHYLYVYTTERFARKDNNSEPLMRLLRVDLATGLVSVITPEVTP